MHSRALITRFGSALLLTLIAADASAQSRFYVGGTAIADIRRFDSIHLDPRILASLADISSRDGTAPGGGVRVGTFLHPQWSLELAVDAGSKTTNSFQNPMDRLPIRSSTLRLPELSTSSSFLTVSTVVGFHPERMGRVRLGYLGGMALVRGTYESTFPDFSYIPIEAPIHEKPVVDSGPRVTHAIGSHHHGRDAAPNRQFSRGRVRARGGHRYERSYCAGPGCQSRRVLQRGSEYLPHQTRSRRPLGVLTVCLLPDATAECVRVRRRRLVTMAMLRRLGLLFLLAVIALPLSAQSTRTVIIQTNSAGDSVHLIDPATDKIVGEIPDAEVIHGVAAAPDGSRLYLSNESTATLDVVDAKTLKITKKIPLTGQPNNVAIRKDGRRAYVAIQTPEGGVDVIDTVAQERVKFIRVLRGVHNTFITPDSRFVVAGSTGGSVATVIDTATELPAWSIHFEGGVRPICFETNPDGSTKRMFVQVTNLHGFAIVDWDKRKEVGTHYAAGRAAGRAQQRGHSGRSRARNPDRTGRQDTVVNQQDQQPRLRVFDARLEVSGWRARGQGARLADVYARQQETLRRKRALEFRVGHRRRGAERDRADQGGTGAEAKHHGQDSVADKLDSGF